jgi:hypothetical protein
MINLIDVCVLILWLALTVAVHAAGKRGSDD